ncbi:protein CBFA2T1 [Hemiscyllium ocellatum]|uniref:protein CBFA2T1 n=1 Tax=Hemiscyllium ocellatum TaxID=170820 RepID=UPI00296626E3|nr:protein CBFA2T1 [Hemiscyllium ocellatum]
MGGAGVGAGRWAGAGRGWGRAGAGVGRDRGRGRSWGGTMGGAGVGAGPGAGPELERGRGGVGPGVGPELGGAEPGAGPGAGPELGGTVGESGVGAGRWAGPGRGRGRSWAGPWAGPGLGGTVGGASPSVDKDCLTSATPLQRSDSFFGATFSWQSQQMCIETGMNGNSQSPTAISGALSTLNGFSNGPATSTSSSLTNQQLPPPCGSRQLCKLKRFLTTLQQFASDLSPEVGEYVRNLVLGLVNSTWTIEEFHSKLQEATNFPLRPFVIPFLKANLPLLQQELIHCTRLTKQTPDQYLAQHETLLLQASSSSSIDTSESVLEVNENGKRKPSARTSENGVVCAALPSQQLSKRPCKLSPGHGFHPRIGLINQPNALPHQTASAPQHYCLEDLAVAHQHKDLHSHPGNRDLRDQQLTTAPRLNRSQQEDVIGHRLTDREWAEEWKNLDNLLNCIMDMVEKTRHSLMVLRHCQEADRVELHHWICCYGNADDMRTEVHGQIAQRYSYIQEEIWKKAEQAVNEIKRQAMIELKQAILEAEHVAQEMITAERVKTEHALAEAKRRASEATQSVSKQQKASSQGCWNCGRKASETCSGCNVAQYCGSSCQHKDWEKHHCICGPNVQRLQPTNTAHGHNALTTSPSPSVTSSRDNPVTPSPSPSVTSGRENPVTPSPSPSVTSGRDNPVTPSPSPSVTSGRDNPVTPSPSPSRKEQKDEEM